MVAVDLRGHGASSVVALLHLEHPYLVGHSLGGVVVTALAGRVASAGVINVDQALELRAFQIAIAMLFGAVYGALPVAEQDRITVLRRPDQAVAKGIWNAVIDDPPEALHVLADTMLGQHGIDPGPGYASWLMPRCPSAQVEVRPDLGHYLHLVDKERFLALVAAFTG